MKKDLRYKERALTGSQWLWFLLVMGFVTRFSLLKLFTAESTDTILDLIYFDSSFVNTNQFYILPGHPFLLKLGQMMGLEGVFWGRIISAVSSVLFLIPLWKLVRKWVSVETAGIICIFALFSPLLWIWSLKAMGDVLFLMIFWWAIERLGESWTKKDQSAWTAACVLGALASLVRPEGFVLFPFILYANERKLISHRFWSRALLIVCWIFPFYLLIPRMTIISLAYREGLGMVLGANAMSDPFLNFIRHWATYITQPIYVFTPILFLLAVLGFSRILLDPSEIGSFSRKVIIPIYVIILISRLIPTAYQDRHMMIFLPLVLTLAGIGLESFFNELPKTERSWRWMFLKNGLIALGLIYVVVFSSAIIILQNDSFGDLKRSAEFLKTLPADAVIYSDEIPKTQYWAGRQVRLLDYSQKPFMPNKGDYVILHSFYTQHIDTVGQTMAARFGAVLMKTESSTVTPLLTDLMQDHWIQNKTAATAFRFEPQFFASVVYRIDH